MNSLYDAIQSYARHGNVSFAPGALRVGNVSIPVHPTFRELCTVFSTGVFMSTQLKFGETDAVRHVEAALREHFALNRIVVFTIDEEYQCVLYRNNQKHRKYVVHEHELSNCRRTTLASWLHGLQDLNQLAFTGATATLVILDTV